MSMVILTILPSMLLSFITIHALYSVLVIRNPILFALLFLAGFAADVICALNELPTLMRTAFVNPLIHIALPIACSEGAQRQRIIRAGVIWLLDPVAELTGFAVTAALGMNPLQIEVNTTTLPSLIMMYATALLIYALACELAIRFFRSSDGRPDASVAPPVLVFLLINTFFCYGLLYRMYGDPATNPNPSMSIEQVVTLVAGSFAGILYGLLALVAARRDVAASQALADDMARSRQRRHVSQRIQETVRGRQDLAYLRHDLANQVDVISSLAGAGHASEAHAYLSRLQERASKIGGIAYE